MNPLKNIYNGLDEKSCFELLQLKNKLIFEYRMLTTSENRYGFPTPEMYTSIEYPLNYLQNKLDALQEKQEDVIIVSVDYGDCWALESFN
ncbi:MAG: hypothetical protein IPO72_06265 [Saprospiraceae bacterium]|nr:hypothetical protein [Candidatus Vicinibacter affinis]HQX44463.1 hypothetical protein [Saprospiraceae bacterium]MBK6572513.1 hypothetical protein [Candidatus Vicinibacter affinis]MBK7304298.1 hypothetical protein [Candidatus Vicinibacter affinis]MBK7694107.1 hypothetical protein [Candidatus Vicinibacter affinis]